MKEYLATLDDAAFGAASGVTPKFVSPSDPAAQWTGAMRGPAFFAFADNYLIDVKFGIIMDVKATRAIRQAEIGAAKTMIERTEERFDIKPAYLAADTAYGSADTLNWVVNEKKIAPHIPVIDKSKREDGTFSREDFRFDEEQNIYICPAGKMLTTTGHIGGLQFVCLVPFGRHCQLIIPRQFYRWHRFSLRPARPGRRNVRRHCASRIMDDIERVSRMGSLYSSRLFMTIRIPAANSGYSFVGGIWKIRRGYRPSEDANYAFFHRVEVGDSSVIWF
jgi:hypothetical protein